MRCPFCGCDEIKTLETRDGPNNTVRRRKECLKCGRRFTTYEYIELVENLMVRKKDGSLERFDIHKIITGIQKACEKRPVSEEKIREIAENVRMKLMKEGKEVVSSRKIGELVMKELKKVDRVAYIRFASVYKEFNEVEDFLKFIYSGKKHVYEEVKE